MYERLSHSLQGSLEISICTAIFFIFYYFFFNFLGVSIIPSGSISDVEQGGGKEIRALRIDPGLPPPACRHCKSLNQPGHVSVGHS